MLEFLLQTLAGADVDMFWIFVPIFILVAGIVVWGRSLPYPFDYQGETYYRLRDGSFTDATKKIRIADPALIAALIPAHKKKKENDARQTDSGDND